MKISQDKVLKISNPYLRPHLCALFIIFFGCYSLHLSGQSAFQYYQKGEQFFNRKEYQPSLAPYQKAVDLDPTFYNAWIKLGLAKGELGDHLDAISKFTVAIKLNPTNSEYYYYRALARQSVSDFESALSDFSKALKLDRKNVKYYMGRAETYVAINDKRGAEKDFAKVIEIDPLNYEAYEKRGIFRLNDENLEGAKVDLLMATKFNDTHFNSQYNLALLYYKIGYRHESVKCLQSIKGFGEETAKGILEKYFGEYVAGDSLIIQNIQSRETASEGFFTDERDKQIYKWINIGGQIWMAENLSYLSVKMTEHLQGLVERISGKLLTLPVNQVEFDSGIFIIPNKMLIPYRSKQECLYNWIAVTSIGQIDGTICPKGWHVPSDKEWSTLHEFVLNGKHLKSLNGWHENGNGENWSGFNALPIGVRGNRKLEQLQEIDSVFIKKKWSPLHKLTDGHDLKQEYAADQFIADDQGFLYTDLVNWDIGKTANFWSSTEKSVSFAWAYNLSYMNGDIHRVSRHKSYEFSVRCVKD